jgi:hypothetical protein
LVERASRVRLGDFGGARLPAFVAWEPLSLQIRVHPGLSPYDGHMLGQVIRAIEKLIGNTIERAHVDAGYRGHNAPPAYQFEVYIAKQKRRVTAQIKREMRRRSAIEPVIGHLKNEYRMDRNDLHHRSGDANKAVLAQSITISAA